MMKAKILLSSYGAAMERHMNTCAHPQILFQPFGLKLQDMDTRGQVLVGQIVDYLAESQPEASDYEIDIVDIIDAGCELGLEGMEKYTELEIWKALIESTQLGQYQTQ